ncbi:MAG: trypsin-like serine protease [Myxococcales bacterium]|nr:MAG: trypsin-like serine protease [Myxococcales bacterium]
MMRLNHFVYFSLPACLYFTACSVAGDSTVEGDEGALVGGSIAKDNEFTSILNISGVCSGVKLSDHRLLTAAHCVTEKSLSETFGANLAEGYKPGAIEYMTAQHDLNRADVPWSKMTIVNTFLPLWWKEECQDGCTVDDYISRAPDLAVIQTVEELPGRAAELDSSAVNPGDEVIITGMGCEGDPNSVDEYGRPIRRLKFGMSKVIRDERYIPSVYEGYIQTNGSTNDASAPLLCPGDSGAGVFRYDPADPSREQLIGINSTFPYDGKVNLHTRLSATSAYGVAQWLESMLNPPPIRPM